MSLIYINPYAFGAALDPDAAAYIAAVEAADSNTLEDGVKTAIDAFVVGCKADGIWSAIKASCILAGARTLTGALVPLVGTAPTNVSNLFVSGDYNRETGLVGNGSTKYLNTNRNNNADPQNNFHAAVYATTGSTNASVYLGTGPITNETGATNFGRDGSLVFSRARCSDAGVGPTQTAVLLVGVSRSSSSSFTLRANSTSYTRSFTSQTPYNGNLNVFATTNGSFPTNSRLAFYSIGEALDLVLLDNRVTALINAFAAAI
jgi:hypothetical protein